MADRYWVGGTDSWNGTAGSKWALTSGGAGGQVEPTASDDVYFDGNSGVVTVTVATSTRVCLSLNFTGFTGTFAGSTALTISGSLTIGAGMSATYSGAITFNATSTGKTLTFNGKTLKSDLIFNGVGGGWTFQDDCTLTTGSVAKSDITLTKGTLDTNGKTVTISGSFSSSNSNTRTLTLGASSIVCQNWSCLTSTNLTFNANTSTITGSDTENNSAIVINLGTSLTYNNVVFQTNTGSGSVQIINTACTVSNLTITGHAASARVMMVGDLTISGTLTMNGNSSVNRLLIITGSAGVPIFGTATTLTAAIIAASNVDFMDITGAGAGSWDLSAISGGCGDCGGNSGITFTTAAPQYWYKNTGSWSDSTKWFLGSGGTGGAGRVPLPQDNVIFDASSFDTSSQTITNDMARIGNSVNWTGVTNTPILNLASGVPLGGFGGVSLFGSLTLISGLSLSSSSFLDLQFFGRGSNTFTTAGITIDRDINFYVTNGTLTLQDNLTLDTTNGSLNLISGTFNANNKDITTTDFNSSNANTRTLTMGSGTWTLNAAGDVWDCSTSTNLTLNSNTSLIKVTNSGVGTVTFKGGGKIYNNLWFSRGSAANTITITGSNTFTDFKDDGTAAHSLRFTTGTTQNVSTFTVSGNSGQLITINSTSTGTHTLTKTGVGTISSNYLNIQHSVVTPADTWYAGDNSIDNQGVATAGSGWTFTSPPFVTTIGHSIDDAEQSGIKLFFAVG